MEKQFSPHQQRVIEERKELAQKREKLGNFLYGNILYFNLPRDDQDLLYEQYCTMKEYEDVLERRIERFYAELS